MVIRIATFQLPRHTEVWWIFSRKANQNFRSFFFKIKILVPVLSRLRSLSADFHTFQIFSSWFLSRSLDVLLKFLHAEVVVLVELWQRLLYSKRCEPGLWALVPALLHDLHYGRQDLQQATAGYCDFVGDDQRGFYLKIKIRINVLSSNCSFIFRFLGSVSPA